MTNKIIDCVTFFENNFMFEFRYNVLKDVVDYFVICEGTYDHRNKPKKIDFINNTYFDKKKIKHIIFDKKFPGDLDIWKNQAIQRDFILENLNFASSDDFILFSDPDEIPEPSLLENLKLKKNMEYLCKNVLIINSIYLINLKVRGKAQEFVKKKILNQSIL